MYYLFTDNDLNVSDFVSFSEEANIYITLYCTD